jgi:hypothetical protein
LLFAKEKETRAVAWTTANVPHKVTMPGVKGKLAVFGFDGQELPPIEAKENGLEMELTDGPKYLVSTNGENIWASKP